MNHASPPAGALQISRGLYRVNGKLFYILGGLLPDGPWNNEPDHVEFEHNGMPCILHRGPAGAWCGYVAVPPGHQWHGKDYDAPDVDVHGGLTYAEKCQGAVCHVAKPGEPEDVWWLGFDCNHSGDLSACDLIELRGQTSRPEGYWTAHYRTVEYVRRQTELLAEQCKEAA